MAVDTKERERLEALKNMRPSELKNLPQLRRTDHDSLTPESRQQTPSVGQRATRLDSRAHGLGATKYIDDMQFPGMLHARFKRAEHAHAKIVNIDVSKAVAMPGVVATLTGDEIPVNSFGPSFQDQPLLAHDKVFHMGDAVVAVAAEDEDIALEAASKIEVEYEPLPAVFDPVEAMRDDAPKIHGGDSNIYATKVIKKGDIEAGFAAADQIFENRYTTQMVEHVPMEPHAAIAEWDANGRLMVWSSLGRITLGRSDLSRILQLPLNKIRVKSTIVGGNFGGKNELTTEPMLALLARKTGRPVKSVYSREDEFISSTTRHPFIMDYKTGVTKAGKITARKIRLICDGGAYCSWSETTLGKAAILSTGPYEIENIHIEALAVYTNKTMTGAMRGFGAPQVCFAYESQMDEIARTLNLDPLEMRLACAFKEGSASPTGQVLESVVAKETMTMAADRFGWGHSDGQETGQ